MGECKKVDTNGEALVRFYATELYIYVQDTLALKLYSFACPCDHLTLHTWYSTTFTNQLFFHS